MRWLADAVYLVAAVVYAPVVAFQAVFQRKNRRGWAERFGRVRFAPVVPKRIWVHAVSLGEVNATRGIVRRLQERFALRQVVVSATTDTGYARACELYGAANVFRFPLDFSFVARRVLDAVDPCLLVLMELEVWFNLTRMAAARGVPVVVVNGRLTERSARRLGRLGTLSRSMFSRLAWVGAQDPAIAQRFRALGVPADRVQVTGSLKWDTAEVADTVAGAEALARAMGVSCDRPLWVCGSTGPGEESIILDAYDRLRSDGVAVDLAIVPRKPERFDEVARLIESRGFACRRRSRRQDTESDSAGACAGGGDGAVLLGDTMGELRKFYSLASVVFVGRSLVAMGGSDPMEAAAVGRPIVAGPHMDNFCQPVEALSAAGVLSTVDTPAKLAERVRAVCADRAAACDAGARARAVVVRNQGATEETVGVLARFVDGAGG